MKKIYFLLLLIITISCDSYLDVMPKGQVIPSTVEDYDLILAASSVSISNSLFMDPDASMPDEAIIASSDRVRNAYLWAENQYPVSIEDGNWSSLYKNIYICNEIIENIDGAKSISGNEALRNEVKGQAHAQRAHLYFWLVNMYGKHYNASTKTSDLAVPMVVKNDIFQQLPRATVAEIYNLIESDLGIAKDLVPENIISSKNNRASLSGVNALLAKISLFKGDFADALTYADDAISGFNGDFQDYNVWVSQDHFLYQSPPFNNVYDPEVIWYGVASSFFGLMYGDEYYLSPSLDALYDRSHDLRFAYWMGEVDPYTGNPFPGGTRYGNWWVKCITASLGELYLIRAECYARTGEAGLAMDDVNLLRKFRFLAGSDYQLSAATSLEALQIVKEERRRELVGTGLYWFDLKRYHMYGDEIPTFTRIVNGQTYTLEPESNRYMMAIPEFTREMNPLLEQNPR